MTAKNRLVALLPMKANSERVKGKNFRPFANKPLFRWMLETLLSMPEIEKVVINTDAREILNQNGLIASDRILIRDRKPQLCGDTVSMNNIIKDDMLAVPADSYIMTHTTNPLLSAETIRVALDKYNKGQLATNSYDCLFAVNKFQTRFYRKNGSPVNHDPNDLKRTQDLETWYEENSNLYIFSETSFAATGARIGNRPILFETPPMESADIDDVTGWHLAETIALSNMLVKSILKYKK